MGLKQNQTQPGTEETRNYISKMRPSAPRLAPLSIRAAELCIGHCFFASIGYRQPPAGNIDSTRPSCGESLAFCLPPGRRAEAQRKLKAAGMGRGERLGAKVLGPELVPLGGDGESQGLTGKLEAALEVKAQGVVPEQCLMQQLTSSSAF